jgi:lipopolysaccharide/colanic/teichoic acid biosynthesis glycosyltransferase
MVILAVVGAVAMHGNPFFAQPRPGKNEKVFLLLKYRTMSNQKDKDGNLLSDEARLNKYGKFLRSTSLDELPELINILLGQMSIVGPRPLLVSYLSRYNAHQKRRHEVRPGLTGLAQAQGRNALSWEERFEMDVWYVDHISLKTDVHILIDTVKIVLGRKGISAEGSVTMILDGVATWDMNLKRIAGRTE